MARTATAALARLCPACNLSRHPHRRHFLEIISKHMLFASRSRGLICIHLLALMPEPVIFSKIQSRQRVAEVKAAVAYARQLDLVVKNEAARDGKMQFNHRVTKNV
jgi:hypothetical protein